MVSVPPILWYNKREIKFETTEEKNKATEFTRGDIHNNSLDSGRLHNICFVLHIFENNGKIYSVFDI